MTRRELIQEGRYAQQNKSLAETTVQNFNETQTDDPVRKVFLIKKARRALFMAQARENLCGLLVVTGAPGLTKDLLEQHMTNLSGAYDKAHTVVEVLA